MNAKDAILARKMGGGSSTVELDTTLTQSGKAADAAAVGDRLSALSEEIANLQTSGLTTAQVKALDGMFKVAAYIKADVSAEYSAFKTAFGIEDSGGTVPEKTLTSISATYTGGDVAVGTAVSDLTGIVVTAHYSDGSTETVTGYTLSGTIAGGENTVTVSYGGKTATFTVTGVAESGGDNGTVLDLTWTAGLISEPMDAGSSTGYIISITNSDTWKYSFPVPVDANTKLIFSTSGPLRQAKVVYLNANVTENLVGSETINKTESLYISGTNASYPSPKELSIPEDAVYFMVNAQSAAIDNNEFTIKLV